MHSVSLTILNALKRLPDLYLADPTVRAILQLDPEEEAWFRECRVGPRESDPLFGRLDAVVDFTGPSWKSSLQFLEPNLCGIGGIHLGPTCDEIVSDLIVPLLQAQDAQLRLQTCHDTRELLMQELLDHLESLGRPRQNIAFIEPTQADSGPDEQEAIARYYHDRHGLKILHADPSELSLRGDDVYFRDEPLELAYRDYEVRDLLTLQREGIDVSPMKALFRQNRVVSSITGDFDQKSCWEVLTDPDLSHAHFHADEREVFRRHVPWTRLLADRRTTLPDGREGELLEFARREREDLVLKPNRAYGGPGVTLGPSSSQADWDWALDLALVDENRWVVQQAVGLPVGEFPVLGPDGASHVEPFYLVMGFCATRYGLSVLARASQKQVVNVAQRGGLCAVLIGQPPRRLVGPGPHE